MQDGTSSLDVFWPATTIIIIITIIINLLLLLLNLYRPPSICPSFQFHFNFIPFSLRFFYILILKSRSFDIIDVTVIITTIINLILLLLNPYLRLFICLFHFHFNFIPFWLQFFLHFDFKKPLVWNDWRNCNSASCQHTWIFSRFFFQVNSSAVINKRPELRIS